MGRFLLHLCAFLAVQAGVFLVLVSGWNTEQHFLRGTKLKHELLDRTPSPRILLVGGSSVAFSLRSDMLQREFGLPTINLGLHAGLYRDFILNEVQAAVGAGDIVLVMLEYEQYGIHAPSVDLLRVAYFRPANLLYYSPRDWAWAGDHGLGFVSKLVTAGALGWRHPNVDPMPLLYQFDSFNEHADLVVDEPSRFTGTGTALPVQYARTQEAIARLNRLNEVCRSKGARLFLGYTPFAKALTEQGLAATRQLDDDLRGGLTFPVLWRPEDCFYPTDWFLDTRYHLVDAAARRHTARIVEALRPYLVPSDDSPPYHPAGQVATAPEAQEMK